MGSKCCNRRSASVIGRAETGKGAEIHGDQGRSERLGRKQQEGKQVAEWGGTGVVTRRNPEKDRNGTGEGNSEQKPKGKTGPNTP